MSGRAIRSRLLTLRRDREAAGRGRELLDQKREVLLRALEARTRPLEQQRARTTEALLTAREALADARIQLGSRGLLVATLAQPEAVRILRQDAAILGVPLPRLSLATPPSLPRYGPADTSEGLDRARQAWADVLPELIALAEQETAVARLEEALRRTVHRLGALDEVVLPNLDAEIREITVALEEEERDEAFRCRRVIASHAGLR